MNKWRENEGCTFLQSPKLRQRNFPNRDYSTFQGWTRHEQQLKNISPWYYEILPSRVVEQKRARGLNKVKHWKYFTYKKNPRDWNVNSLKTVHKRIQLKIHSWKNCSFFGPNYSRHLQDSASTRPISNIECDLKFDRDPKRNLTH